MLSRNELGHKVQVVARLTKNGVSSTLQKTLSLLENKIIIPIK